MAPPQNNTVLKAALLIVVLNVSLFMHGCEKSGAYNMLQTAGFPIPYAEIVFDDVKVVSNTDWEIAVPKRLVSFDPVWLPLNFAALCVGLALVCRYCPRAWNEIGSRRFLACFAVGVFLLHTMFVWGGIWGWAVFWPTLYIGMGLSNFPLEGNTVWDIASRVWFCLSVTILWAVTVVIGMLRTRRAMRMHAGSVIALAVPLLLLAGIGPHTAVADEAPANAPQLAISDDVIGQPWPQPKAAPAAAPTLVLLPPRIEADDIELLRPTAELLCDALAAHLGATGRVHVVDRSQLERLLNEQKIKPEPKPAFRAFDAMVRLHFRPRTLVPQLQVDVIDLSTGNVLQQAALDWPLDPQSLPQLVTVCLKGAERVAGIEDGAKRHTRVRLLGPTYDAAEPRLAPLAERLGRVFRQLLGDSPQLDMVMHLESGSAKEESLLLLMGLARLGGGRQFVPNADATVELQLAEREAAGKSFQDTPITLRMRLRQGTELAGEWQTVQGPVREFDRAIEGAWSLLADQLATVDRTAAAKVIQQSRSRRKLAEAELSAKLPPGKSEIETYQAQIRRAEAALKIDPTYDEARFALLQGRGLLLFYSITPVMNGKIPKAAGFDAGDRFLSELTAMAADPVEPRERLLNEFALAGYAVRMTPLWTLLETNEIVIAPDDRRRLQALRTVVDFALSDPNTSRAASPALLRIVFRGMRAAGVRRSERLAWLEQTVARCLALEPRMHEVEPFFRGTHLTELRVLILVAASLLVEDDARPQAGKALVRAEKFLLAKGEKSDAFLPLLKETLAGIGDANVTARFERRVTASEHPVSLISTWHIDWPRPKIFGDEPDVPHTMIRVSRYHGYRPITPIAGDDKRMYVLLAENGSPITWTYGVGVYSTIGKPTVAFLDLDTKGHPRGGDVEEPFGRHKRMVWKGIRQMPQPNLQRMGEFAAKMLGDKLCLATTTSGLFVFDPKLDAWTQYSVRDGLPTDRICSIFPLDDRTLFCCGKIEIEVARGAFNYRVVHFTLDVVRGEAKLIRQSDYGKPPYLAYRMTYVWQHDGRWRGLAGQIYDDLLSKDGKLSGPRLHPVDAAEWQGRRFYSSESGLHEFDGEGKTIRSWRSAGKTTVRTGLNEFSIPCLADTPVGGRFMVRCGDLLVMSTASYEKGGITAYEPATDTWHGPLLTRRLPYYMIGTPTGIWLGLRDGLCFVGVDDFRVAAESGGRVLKVEQFREIQAEAVAMGAVRESNRAPHNWGALPDPNPSRATDDWQRSLLAIQARDWQAAASGLRDVLAKNPDHAHALLLAGLIHDQWGLNQPDQALTYYDRLTQHTNRNAAFTGLYYSMCTCLKQKNYDRVSELTEQLHADFPVVSDDWVRRDLDT